MNFEDRVFIIAEAGVNHNGDLKLAKRLVDAALSCGVDAVKFQTWRTELLVNKSAPMAEYQIKNTKRLETQSVMLKKLELSYKEFKELKDYCDKCGILFISTPDEEDSATFLNDLQPIFKIGSGELSNVPFLQHIAKFNKPIILSTGMGYLSEVEEAIFVVRKVGLSLDKITVLHATTDYPTDYDDVNLTAMKTIESAFPGVRVGYSDHTMGIEVATAAVALGAKVIEKHFTLDRSFEGPDHKASLEPNELASMVSAIRNIEKAMGNGWKVPTNAEKQNRDIVRKSVVAAKEIPSGTILSHEMLKVRRPGGGIPPSKLGGLVGTVALKDYNEGDLI